LAAIPTVIVYRMSWVSWVIGRLLVRLHHVGLPNLLAGRPVMPELLQSACTPENIAMEVRRLLGPSPDRDAQVEAMTSIRAQLAPAGSQGAARRAAEEVAALLGNGP
jgi:lipid-A-disaccharide synthase